LPSVDRANSVLSKGSNAWKILPAAAAAAAAVAALTLTFLEPNVTRRLIYTNNVQGAKISREQVVQNLGGGLV
jgi:hypothetical protein